MPRTTHDRPGRVAAQVQQVIAERLAEGLKDPALDGMMITVTAVKMTPDLREARVYLSVYGDEKLREAALEALGKAKGLFKREIARQLKLRLTPEIHFEYDETIEHADRIDKLLKDVKAKEGW